MCIVCDGEGEKSDVSDGVSSVELVVGTMVMEAVGKRREDEEELVSMAIVSVKNMGKEFCGRCDGGMGEKAKDKEVTVKVGTTTDGVKLAVDCEEGVVEDADG